jgi:predicted MarR family transcription regulator
MLGVRREGVTAAVQQLQKLGLIHCTRGHVAVVDRRGLEHRACECYTMVRQEYERLLPLARLWEFGCNAALLQTT